MEVTFAGRGPMSGRWNADRSVAGGGVLIDNATHAVDLVRHLVGDVVEVAAVHGPSGQPVDVEDSSTLIGRTADGVLAQVDVTWSFRRLSPVYCAVYGTAGSVEIGWGGAQAVTVETPQPHTVGSGYKKIDSLRANLEAVLAALAAGVAPPVSPGRRRRRGRGRRGGVRRVRQGHLGRRSRWRGDRRHGLRPPHRAGRAGRSSSVRARACGTTPICVAARSSAPTASSAASPTSPTACGSAIVARSMRWFTCARG